MKQFDRVFFNNLNPGWRNSRREKMFHFYKLLFVVVSVVFAVGVVVDVVDVVGGGGVLHQPGKE